MAQCKADRLARVRRALIDSRIDMAAIHVGRYTAANPAEIIPGFGDVCFNMKEVRDLILTSAPDVEIDESSFTECMLKLPEFCRAWRTSKDAALLGLVAIPDPYSASSATATPDISPLQLAATYFQCRLCESAIHYPRILTHSCMTSITNPLQADTLPADEDLQELALSLLRMPWNYSHDRIAFSEDYCYAAFFVVDATNKNVMTTTAAEMDELNGRYECLICLDAGRPEPPMTWRAAVCIYFAIDHVCILTYSVDGCTGSSWCQDGT